MLYEITNVKSYADEPGRRWFFDHDIDLTVWFDESGNIIGFQVCYDKPQNPHALTWWKDKGYQHHLIDDGERCGTSARKGIPILMADGFFDKDRIAELFQSRSENIDPEIALFVDEKIRQYEVK